MSSPAATFHVLDKQNYSKHCLVKLSNEVIPSLAPSSIRFRPRIIGLTTNNLTYARFGAYMGWYDIYPLPPTTPAPYNDSKAYARIAAWGYADIVESTLPGISPGQTIYGFLPISTGIETVHIEFAEHNGTRIADQIIVLDQHRQHLWKIYNRYRVCAPLSDLETSPGIDSLGYDALMSGLFGTSYNLNRYAFAWDDTNRIHPSGTGEWSSSSADLKDAIVIILNASGKTGMSFAYTLRHNRPSQHQPAQIIGVGSPASIDLLKATKLFDSVVLNDAYEQTTSLLESSNPKRIVLLDFGARENAASNWSDTLSASTSLSQNVTRIAVGGEVSIQDPEKAKKRFSELGSLILVNASLLREKGIEVEGRRYFEEAQRAFEGFKRDVKALKLVWGVGVEGWEEGWERLCRDEVRADRGLVYRL